MDHVSSPIEAQAFAPPPPDAELDEIRCVVAKARQGDETAVPRLQELLTTYPSIWQRYGDLAGHAREAWIVLAAGPDLHLRECLRRQVEALRQQLIGTSTNPLVLLSAERVIVTWLQAGYFDALEAQATLKAEPLRLLAFRAKRQAQANRQHLTAIAALATIRKLLPDDAGAGGSNVAADPTVPQGLVETVQSAPSTEPASEAPAEMVAAAPLTPLPAPRCSVAQLPVPQARSQVKRAMPAATREAHSPKLPVPLPYPDDAAWSHPPNHGPTRPADHTVSGPPEPTPSPQPRRRRARRNRKPAEARSTLARAL